MRKISEENIKHITELRKLGWSLPEIKKKLDVGYGTIYRYANNVAILPAFRKEWFGKRGGSFKRRLMLEQKARDNAKKLIPALSHKEKMIFMAALYWGEGNKKDFNLLNSDPNMIKIFVRGLLELFNVSTDELRVSIRIYDDLDKNKCLNFWSRITKIPINKFVSINVLKGKKNGKLIHGMCRIRVKKAGNLLKYMLAIRDTVVENF